jgi:hypothetical protein
VGDGGRRILSSRPAQANLARTYLKKQNKNKRHEGIAQMVEQLSEALSLILNTI